MLTVLLLLVYLLYRDTVEPDESKFKQKKVKAKATPPQRSTRKVKRVYEILVYVLLAPIMFVLRALQHFFIVDG